jgi:AcrR family transcriptional regulator
VTLRGTQKRAAPARAPKKRAPLSRERVLQAALSLADADGLAALTMRALGQRLGVEAMSLYKHVAHKDDLLDGLVDEVMGEIDVPAPGTPWRAALLQRSTSARAVFLRHRWAATLIESRLSPGPRRLRHHDAVLGALRAGGFSVAQAYAAFLTVDSYVYGFVLQEAAFPVHERDRGVVVEQLAPAIDPKLYPHIAEMMAFVAERSGKDPERAADVDFAFGLELILDALGASVRAR